MVKVKTEGHDLVCPVVFEGMVNGGLTKRELFASAVMQAMISYAGRAFVNDAVVIADSLIEALNKPKGDE